MKIFLLICCLGVSLSIDCLSKNSEPVDWWVILKLPFPLGDQFYYCDSNDCSWFEKGETLITSIDAPFLMTVSQVNQSPLKLIWNDQPNESNVMTNHAHSKGLIAADDDGSAIIINHSIPQFPILDTEGNIYIKFPSNALKFGQHIFCLSTTLIEIENISTSYIAAKINVFQSTFPIGLIATHPNLFQLSKQKYPFRKSKKRTPSSTPFAQNFTTRSGQKMQMFYKEPSNEVEFYGLLSQHLKVGFLAQTWGNGIGGQEDPECKIGQESLSNTWIHIYDDSQPNDYYSYYYTQDHSKYAISLKISQPYVCFADFNRQISQHRRGGTAICFIDTQTWASFDSFLTDRQQC